MQLLCFKEENLWVLTIAYVESCLYSYIYMIEFWRAHNAQSSQLMYFGLYYLFEKKILFTVLVLLVMSTFKLLVTYSIAQHHQKQQSNLKKYYTE